MELFLFTMHQLALPSDPFCDDRPLSRAFLTEWLRRHRQSNAQTLRNGLLTDDLHLTAFERQQLLAGLASCYNLPLSGAETEKLHTIPDVETYLQNQLGNAAA